MSQIPYVFNFFNLYYNTRTYICLPLSWWEKFFLNFFLFFSFFNFFFCSSSLKSLFCYSHPFISISQYYVSCASFLLRFANVDFPSSFIYHYHHILFLFRHDKEFPFFHYCHELVSFYYMYSIWWKILIRVEDRWIVVMNRHYIYLLFRFENLGWINMRFSLIRKNILAYEKRCQRGNYVNNKCGLYKLWGCEVLRSIVVSFWRIFLILLNFKLES